MDPAALAMLADLGLERRDIVSAPDDDRRAHVDPREQARVAAESKARRAKLGGEAKGAESERDARLRAWNSK